MFVTGPRGGADISQLLMCSAEIHDSIEDLFDTHYRLAMNDRLDDRNLFLDEADMSALRAVSYMHSLM